MVSRHERGKHTTVTHETVTIRRPHQLTERRTIGLADVPEWLSRLAVGLTADDEGHLRRRLAEIRRAARSSDAACSSASSAAPRR